MNINENKSIEANEPDHLNMSLTDVMREVAKLGVDYFKHGELIDEMYWDGHSPFEIKQQIEVLEGDYSI